MSASLVPRAARSVRREWDLLSSGTQPLEVFDPSMVARLPEPARRWLVHAIAPGTPLWQTVELSMRGEIRLGAWRPPSHGRCSPRPGASSGPPPHASSGSR